MGFSPLRPIWDKLQVGDQEDVKEAIAALQESEWLSSKAREKLEQGVNREEAMSTVRVDIFEAWKALQKVLERGEQRQWGDRNSILVDDTLEDSGEPIHPLVTGVLFSSHTTVSLDTVNGINRRTPLPRNPARWRAISLTTRDRLQKNTGASSKPTDTLWHTQQPTNPHLSQRKQCLR
jgi:hypothetical protein